jgi:hypothetical protein
MNWHKLTLSQYQQLYPVITSEREDKDFEIVRIVNNLTEKELDSLPMSQFKALLKESAFIYSLPEHVVPKYLKGKKRRYKILYDIQNAPFARYAEVKTFTGSTESDFIQNMHKLAASMVLPQKRVLGIWRDEAYDSNKHPEYADDLLDCSFISVYNSCVFFYHLYNALMHSLKGFMVGNLMLTSLSRSQAEEVHQVLCDSLDGFITANSLPPLKESVWRRLGISRPCEHLTPSLT